MRGAAPTAVLPAAARRGPFATAAPWLLGLLAVLLAIRAVGVVLDFANAVGSPVQLDYGEGIVWQQATLILGPRAYGTSPALPFIVFHYPPLYHLVTRAVGVLTPDLMVAGRLVSVLSALAFVPLVAGLVLVAAPSRAPGRLSLAVLVAVTMGLLALDLHAVRLWGMMMRVDMLAIALAMAGLLVAARADGRFGGVLVGLLLCLASVYTKQTEFPAGVAVAVVSVLRRPKAGVTAVAVAFTVGGGCLIALEISTHGGFLRNIIFDNVNRLGLRYALGVVLSEGQSAPIALLAVVAAAWLLAGLWQVRAGVDERGVVAMLRRLDRPGTARALILLHFAMATLLLLTTFKSGGNVNYLIEWLCAGTVLLGVMLRDMGARPHLLSALLLALCLYAARLPMHYSVSDTGPATADADAVLVRRIAAATKPVIAENVTLLMRAGKQVWFEPSIVQELVATGQWDEAPLLNMIRARGFAFVVTRPHTTRLTPAILAAVKAAYPRVEQAGPALRIHLPQ